MTDTETESQYGESCGEAGCDFVGVGPTLQMAKMQRGRHRRQVHGIEGRATSKKKAGPRQAAKHAKPRTEEPTPLRVIADATDAISGKRPPTEEQLENALGQIVAYSVAMVATVVVEGDPRPLPEEYKEELATNLALTKDESKELVAPIARILARSKVNKRYGRAVVDNVDVVECISVATTMMIRWSSYLRERKQGAPIEAQSWVPYQPPPPPANSYYEGHQPGTAAPVNGVVVDADYVARMREGGR